MHDPAPQEKTRRHPRFTRDARLHSLIHLHTKADYKVCHRTLLTANRATVHVFLAVFPLVINISWLLIGARVASFDACRAFVSNEQCSAHGKELVDMLALNYTISTHLLTGDDCAACFNGGIRSFWWRPITSIDSRQLANIFQPAFWGLFQMLMTGLCLRRLAERAVELATFNVIIIRARASWPVALQYQIIWFHALGFAIQAVALQGHFTAEQASYGMRVFLPRHSNNTAVVNDDGSCPSSPPLPTFACVEPTYHPGNLASPFYGGPWWLVVGTIFVAMLPFVPVVLSLMHLVSNPYAFAFDFRLLVRKPSIFTQLGTRQEHIDDRGRPIFYEVALTDYLKKERKEAGRRCFMLFYLKKVPLDVDLTARVLNGLYADGKLKRMASYEKEGRVSDGVNADTNCDGNGDEEKAEKAGEDAGEEAAEAGGKPRSP